MVQALTGGTLLLRNIYYIVIYRGKDFVPTSVAAVLAERQEMTKQIQDVEEKVRCRAVDATLSGQGEATVPAGSLAEFYEAQARWGRDISTEEREKMIEEAAKAKTVKLVKQIEHRLSLVSIYIFYEHMLRIVLGFLLLDISIVIRVVPRLDFLIDENINPVSFFFVLNFQVMYVHRSCSFIVKFSLVVYLNLLRYNLFQQYMATSS